LGVGWAVLEIRERRHVEAPTTRMAATPIALSKTDSVPPMRPNTNDSAKKPPPIEVSLKCTTGGSLPLRVLPKTTEYIIPVNKALNIAKNWGFNEIANNEDVPMQWPSPINFVPNPGDPMFVQKCGVTNHGQTNLTELDIPLRVRYGDDPTLYTYHVMISPLDSSKSFTFYVVNGCPIRINIMLPNTSSATVAGEADKRKFDLEMEYPPNHIPNYTFSFGLDPAKVNVLGMKCE